MRSAADHLLIKAWLCEKALLYGRDFIKPHNPVMVETGIIAARLFEVSALWGYVHFLLDYKWYHGMEPRYLLCGCCKTYCFVVVGWEALRIKVGNDREVAYSCQFLPSYRGNPALCSRVRLGSRGRPSKGVPFYMVSSLALPFAGNPKKQYDLVRF